jgi:DNA gyrase/topoisomerase IV subunit A
MLISDRGTIIRVPKESISRLGRSTQGVRVMSVNAGTNVVSIDCLEKNEKDSEPPK